MSQPPPNDPWQNWQQQPNNPSGPQWPPQQPSQPLPPPQYTQYPQQGYGQQPWPQQQPGYPPPPQPPKKKSRRGLWIVLGVVAVLLIGCIGAVAAATNATQNTVNTNISTLNTAVSTTSTGNTPAPKPTSSFASFGDGTYQVGKDIQPGTYRTRAGSSGCYYERVKGFSGSLNDIIANNNTDFPAIVTILATDKGFDTRSCDTWTKDLSQITSSKTTFSDGMYFIGTDITSGTYRNSGGDSCYLARLSGFGNGLDDIISNNNVKGSTIITIAASDKGFESRGCGTWKKL